jgi:DNA-binding XRE family transcriptional regulator
MEKHTDERPIPGLDGYTATAHGRVISYRSGTRRELSPRTHKGYRYVNVRRGVGRATAAQVSVHSLILLAFVGPKPTPAHECRHLNGDAQDNRASNLLWGTSAENAADCTRHGTAAWLRRGVDSNSARLTEQDVRIIERRARCGETQASIASDYGVTQRHVSNIKNHRTWRHLWLNDDDVMRVAV